MGLINLLGIINEGLYNLVSSLYTFLGTLYNFLVGLSNIEFLKETYLNDFTTTVYVLAGIFMLFRVAVSFLSALVDPDKLSDKNESPSKLLTRMIIVIVLMIALVPNSYVYDYLGRLQNAIINPNDGLIVNLFSKAKKKAEKDAKKEGRTLNNDGLQFSRNLLGTMTTCDDEDSNSDGVGTTYNTDDSDFMFTGSSGFVTSSGLTTVASVAENNNAGGMAGTIGGNSTVDEVVKAGKNSKKIDTSTCEGIRTALLDNTYRDDITDALDDKFSISWLIAILVGIAVIVYLLVLCIEVVVRGLKLVFLQMVAPIAIISYVSPKDKILPEWAKMYVSTYIDIFIKLIAIQIGALFLLGFQFSEEPIKNLFVILGILVFMKLIPTMISKIFGIDLASGTFKDSMGMLKKASGVATGAALAGTVGALTGKGFSGKIAGATRGIAAGSASGAKGDIYSGAKNTATKNQRINTSKDQGLNFLDRAAATFSAKSGMPTKGAIAKNKLEKINGVAAANKDLKDWAEGEAVKKNAIATDFSYKDANGNSLKFGEQLADYKKLKEKSKSVALTTDEQERMNNLQRQGFANFENGVGVGELQSKLDALESRDTSRMSDVELATHARTLTETKSMLAAAKTSAAANYLRANKNDAEVISRVGKVNEAINEARIAGIDSIKVEGGDSLKLNKISLDNIDGSTIKTIKETAYGMQNAIGKEAEKDLAKERYGNTNS